MDGINDTLHRVAAQYAASSSRRGFPRFAGGAALALALAFAAGCLLAAPGATHTTAASGPLASPAVTRTALPTVAADNRLFTRTFLRAYNEHDLGSVLTLLSSDVKYSDCDYLRQTEVRFMGRVAVRGWLRTLFEDDDRFERAQILTSSRRPQSVGVVAMRVNDLLKVQELAPLSPGAIKVILNRQRNQIDVWGAGGPPCNAHAFPRGASVVHTKTVVQRFVDAYNGHDVTGVLATLTRNVTYGDCDYARHQLVILQGKTAVRRWLRARFAEHDRFKHVKVGARADDPTDGGFAATRVSDVLRPLEGRGLVPRRLGYKIILDRQGSKIEHTAMSGSLFCYARARSLPPRDPRR